MYTGLNPIHYRSEGEVTHIPLIHIVPNAFSRPDIALSFKNFLNYTHIIITSKSIIKILIEALYFFGYSIEDWKRKYVIVVGSTTAYYLREVGIHSLIIAKEETAEGIIKELNQFELRHYSFFWPHSAQARSVISDFFHEKSIPLSHCSLYNTLFVELPSIPDLDQFDEIVFTSPSTIHAFLQIFGTIPTGKILTCIGPITQQSLSNVL